MKNFIIIVSGAVCISMSMVGCAKHIAPTTVAGQECVRAAVQLKSACENERVHELRACDERNYRRKQIQEEHINRQLANGEITADNARGQLNSLSYNQGENCQQLTAHCRNQYKSNFLACGGRIE